jgi:hypothetical protein
MYLCGHTSTWSHALVMYVLVHKYLHTRIHTSLFPTLGLDIPSQNGTTNYRHLLHNSYKNLSVIVTTPKNNISFKEIRL